MRRSSIRISSGCSIVSAWVRGAISGLAAVAGSPSSSSVRRDTSWDDGLQCAAALAALTEANRLLVLAEEIIGCGHWRVELPSGRRTWSPGLYAIYRAPPESALPPFDFDLDGYHVDDRERVRAVLAGAAAIPGPFAYEARILRRDASVATVTVRGTADRAPSGTALFGVMLDVTETRALADRLRTREHQMGSIIDAMPALVGHWDADMCNVLANGAYTTWFGVDASGIRGMHLADVVGTEMFERHLPRIEAVLRGEPQRFESRIVLPDGEEKLAAISYLPSVQDGRRDGFFVLAVDMTERREAADRLHASETFADRIGRVAGIGGWEMDVASERIRWSAQTRRIHEVEEDHAPTMDGLLDHFPGAARAIMASAQARALEEGTAWNMELPFVTARGRSIWVLSTGEAELRNGIAFRILGILQDITMRKLAEGARDTADLLIAEARDIAETARGIAEHATGVKSAFLADISHELRTPIASILGHADLLTHDGRLGAEELALVANIASSSMAALVIVDELLDIKKIEAGRLTLNPVGFGLRGLIDDAIAVMAGLATRQGVALLRHVATEVPDDVFGDPARLRQVLLNLLSNAVKFTVAGTVMLRIRLAERPGRSATVHFTVSDTGIGISQDGISRLFTRFGRIDDTPGRYRPGTGLGLAISKGLVDLMGGEITVDSVESVGSSFSFYIPLPRFHPAAVPAPERRAARAGTARILIVEDVAANREMTARTLVAAGHRVDEAPDGLSAVSLLSAAEYDVVFMDIQMPDVGGIEATEMIRASLGPSRCVPIFALTASVSARLAQAVKSAGMNGILQKPLGVDALLTIVDRTLHGFLPQPFRTLDGAFTVRRPSVEEDLRTSIGDAAFIELSTRFRAMLQDAIDAAAHPFQGDDVLHRLREIENGGRAFGFVHLARLSGLAADHGVSSDDRHDLMARFCEAGRQVLSTLAPERNSPPDATEWSVRDSV